MKVTRPAPQTRKAAQLPVSISSTRPLPLSLIHYISHSDLQPPVPLSLQAMTPRKGRRGPRRVTVRRANGPRQPWMERAGKDLDPAPVRAGLRAGRGRRSHGRDWGQAGINPRQERKQGQTRRRGRLRTGPETETVIGTETAAGAEVVNGTETGTGIGIRDLEAGIATGTEDRCTILAAPTAPGSRGEGREAVPTGRDPGVRSGLGRGLEGLVAVKGPSCHQKHFGQQPSFHRRV